MNIWKRAVAAVFSLILVLCLISGVYAFAEGDESSPAESSEVQSSSEEVSSEAQKESSSEEKKEEKSSSVAESSSEQSSESSSSIAEEDKYDYYSYSSSGKSRSMISSSEEDDISDAYIISDDSTRTEVKIGLPQPNDKIVLNAEQINVSENDNKELYDVLKEAAKGKPIEYCFKLTITGDPEFDSDVTVVLPVDPQLIGREMNLIFYDGKTVSSSNKTVSEYVEPSDGSEQSESYEPSLGIIKNTRKLTVDQEYIFCVCEIADFVPASHGIGLLEVSAIIVGSLALMCGGLLAFLIIRDKKMKKVK